MHDQRGSNTGRMHDYMGWQSGALPQTAKVCTKFNTHEIKEY